MNGRLLVFVVVCLALAGPAGASIIINVGAHNLIQNSPGQVVQIFVTGGDQVTAFNLRAVIGDGMGDSPEPKFQSINFNGGIWDVAENTVIGGPIGGFEQDAQAYVAFNTSVSVPANGLLVTLTIDTTGFFSGSSFPLLLKSTEIGSDSDFVVIGGATLAADITNGMFNIVPEPAPIAGDANGDGVVDAADYIILKRNFGMTGAQWLDGDFSGDHQVNWTDLQLLISHFGTSGTATATTPEPATLFVMMAAGLPALLKRRRRVRS